MSAVLLLLRLLFLRPSVGPIRTKQRGAHGKKPYLSEVNPHRPIVLSWLFGDVEGLAGDLAKGLRSECTHLTMP